MSGIRIAKYLAQLGVDSRRQVEARIARGEITVNGVQVTTPAFFVAPDDEISLLGVPVRGTMPRARLFLYHKPCGLVVSHKDPQGRPTVFEAMPAHLPRLISVGRLDLNSQGLLLMTNNGALARTLEHPRTGLKRTYRVRVWGRVCPEQLNALKGGVTVEGITYGPIEAQLVSQTTSNAWLTLSLREGKNREIRKVMGHLGLEVNVLTRTSYGPFDLGDLKTGGVEEVAQEHFSLYMINA